MGAMGEVSRCYRGPIYMLGCPHRALGTCRKVFADNCILPLPSVYTLKTLLHTKHNLNRLSKHSDCHDYFTRNGNNLMISKHSLSKFEKSEKLYWIKLYNHLPQVIKEMPTGKFKKVLKRLLGKEGYYSIDEYYASSLL
ncbi:hypothetical protein JTB14_035699 [Gonioctena quinquepunctata]|nr:hypothetical protein JTB14_035699 [Gonioctena quinquepunctata]